MIAIRCVTVMFTVVFIGGFIQSKVGIKNCRDIVNMPLGCEDTIADDW